MSDRLYPQFATHNAHTVAAVMHMAGGRTGFEFQRLHGMGETLHESVREAYGTCCRIYAPVGVHHDLLAYLVRRLLENGANSSFVNQIVDESVTAEEIARDPVRAIETYGSAVASPAIAPPAEIFAPNRRNAKGWDLADPLTVEAIEAAREPFRTVVWEAAPMIAGPVVGAAHREVRNPARPDDIVGTVTDAAPADIETAMEAAREGAAAWGATSAGDRARILCRVADIYEAHAPELFELAAREAGKTWPDCVGEVREASDFARFYANEALRASRAGRRARCGVIACISPWNFPVAIFSGQIFGALAAGNAVIAKPAEQTPLIAARASALMHEAGIPRDALQLLPGDGATVGTALVSDPRIDGVCFTGSTGTAGLINRAIAEHLSPDAPFIAETGGLNAMVVDSTALPEQAVRDIVASAFQSAGQRCSALRVLYVQREVEERILTMLFGAMDELRIGDPWELATDVGPVIDEDARGRIEAHCVLADREGRVFKRLAAPGDGTFVPPTVLRVDGIDSLAEEVFGPVLHVATFGADEIDGVVDAINATGFGLTFGLHTRIDDRVQHIVDRVRAGNIYVNRNQIGAVVGSQPFGGEGLSGTGPKAGGPHYVRRLMAGAAPDRGVPAGAEVDEASLAAAIADAGCGLAPGSRLRGKGVFGDHRGRGARAAPLELPGPTGESNRLSLAPRGVVLCLGPRDRRGTRTARDGPEGRECRGGGRCRCTEGPRVPRCRSPGDPSGRTGCAGHALRDRGHRRGRLLRGSTRAPGDACRDVPACRSNPAAHHRAGLARALHAGAPCLRRHDGGGRQRVAARAGGRLTAAGRRQSGFRSSLIRVPGESRQRRGVPFGPLQRERLLERRWRLQTVDDVSEIVSLAAARATGESN